MSYIVVNKTLSFCQLLRGSIIQSEITSSKLTIETLEQGVNMFKVTVKTPERRH